MAHRWGKAWSQGFAIGVVCLAPACGGRLASSQSSDGGSTSPVGPLGYDYFFCHVEPQYLFAYRCGPGDPSKGDPPGGCHFAPIGMTLQNHPAVDCGGGDTVIDRSAIVGGSPAQYNYTQASFQIGRGDYTSWPLYARPAGSAHPRQIFDPGDSTVVMLLRTWSGR